MTDKKRQKNIDLSINTKNVYLIPGMAVYGSEDGEIYVLDTRVVKTGQVVSINEATTKSNRKKA